MKRKIAEYTDNDRITTKVYLVPEFAEYEVRQFMGDEFIGNYFTGKLADVIETVKFISDSFQKA